MKPRMNEDAHGLKPQITRMNTDKKSSTYRRLFHLAFVFAFLSLALSVIMPEDARGWNAWTAGVSFSLFAMALLVLVAALFWLHEKRAARR